MRGCTLGLLGLVACGGVDLTVPVADGAVIAGVIDDEAALFGGTAAEGRLGDVLIQNSRVRFVVQAARDDGHYYESVGGGIIDADIVRPAGQAGRDPVDEWMGMFGLGRITRATSVEVIDDGRRSGEAIVRVTGVESPLTLLTGSLERPSLVPDIGLTVVTDYVLRPDTPLLEVRSTVTVGAETTEVAPGDVLQGGLETVRPWDPGVGLDAPGEDDRRFTGYLGRHNEAAWAIVPETGQSARIGSDGQLLASIGDLVVTFQDVQPVPAGGELSYVRYYGVGEDMAAITDAVLALDGTPVRTESGVVTSGGRPVAGARVHVLLDGEPFTVAFTDADGAFSADVPTSGEVTVRASGQLDGVTLDLPEGQAQVGPYAVESANARARGAGPPIAAAESYGLAPVDDPLVLPEPARLTVRSDDGAPFEVRVVGQGGESDPRLVEPPEGGALAIGWARDGEIELAVPAGALRVEVHRGVRFERDVAEIQVAPGEARTVEVQLTAAIEADGWLVADPHMHAGPSPDGLISMEERLLGAAARGIQLHFGTDHDHVVDYRPLVQALQLGPYLRSVVACEVSPVLRGHMNVYPLTPDPSRSNNGAIRWWEEVLDTTDAFVARFDTMGGGGRVFVQANHPLDMGVASAARWQPGAIRRPERWTGRLDLMEVNNAGAIDEVVPLFLDLISRGYPVVPVSVSDSHGATSGGMGLNVTFIGTGTDLQGYTDEALTQALAVGRTVASRGVFLDLSIDPGSTITGSASLQVTAVSASWAPVDRLVLLRDGEPAQTVQGTTATFDLSPDADAVYVVVAEGDTPMGGPYGSTTPWALASPIYVDVAGDGWQAPKEPLSE